MTMLVWMWKAMVVGLLKLRSRRVMRREVWIEVQTNPHHPTIQRRNPKAAFSSIHTRHTLPLLKTNSLPRLHGNSRRLRRRLPFSIAAEKRSDSCILSTAGEGAEGDEADGAAVGQEGRFNA